ncbi:LacI family transcriptional regulator [Occultella glacieicola]|uniref:LacI family transcriptional regulator n=1 Tax=Occultella glacieicola TaxID=2518684 RepID=A0ABY2E7Y6_9MICO|nr:LacI family DNA-binding transcriptional regulator [Occultella glacieicola]TDE94827.1 LacI family transcriptional regulator [Occultella glacieicola]
MATVKSIAAAAGVSPSVVSAVLHGSKHVRVSEATRARVQRAVDAAGYVPNHAARALRLQRTGVLALVLPKLDNPVYHRLVDGIYDAADAHGYSVLLGDGIRATSGSLMLQRMVGGGQVDGTLIRPGATISEDVLTQIRAGGGPIVILDDVSAEDHWVALQDELGAYLATRHLVEKGHERIAYLGQTRYQHDRVVGYRRALSESGLPAPDDYVIHSLQGTHDGYERFPTLLDLDPRPTAVLVNNVTTAVGVLAAATDAGLTVPDDLAVIGYHETTIAADLRPSLSTVEMPLYELGRVGVDLMHTALTGEPVDSHTITEPLPRVIERQSTA